MNNKYFSLTVALPALRFALLYGFYRPRTSQRRSEVGQRWNTKLTEAFSSGESMFAADALTR